MTSPTFGIVVPTRGTRPRWLEETLSSIRQQSVAAELILVGPEASLRDISVRFDATILDETGRGLSEAINQGFEYLRTRVDYFSWLGDDDLLAQDAMKSVADLLMRYADTDVVFGRTMYIDADAKVLYRGRTGLWAVNYMRSGQDYVPQPGSFLRSRIVETSEPLVDPMLRNAMDLDMFLRLRDRGARFRYVPRVLSFYRIHGDAITSQKGAKDESSTVRGRYSRPLVMSLWDRARPVRSRIEWAFIATQWHLPQIGVRKGVVPRWIEQLQNR